MKRLVVVVGNALGFASKALIFFFLFLDKQAKINDFSRAENETHHLSFP